MKKNRKKALLLALLLTVSFVFTACGKGNDTAQKKDKIVVGISQDFDSLDPHKAVATGTEEVMFNVFTGLLNVSPTGEIIPEIAESYQVSGDLKTYTFQIKRDITFHNGEPLTAADVVYSYNRVLGKTKDQKSPLKADLSQKVKEVKETGDFTVEITLNNPDGTFASNCLLAIIPQESGDGQETDPVGAGPYRFTGYTPGVSLTMTRHDNFYTKGLSKIKDLEFRIFSDSNTSLLALQTGEIGLMFVNDRKLLQGQEDNLTITQVPSNGVQLMGLNQEYEPFGDIRVRKAINMLVDKQEIIDAVSPGSEMVGTNFSPAMSLYYEPSTKEYYKVDIEGAKKLLKEAGQENLKFTIKVPSEYKIHVDTAQLVKEQLAKGGVSVTIETIEWNTWLEEVYQDEKYECTIIGFTGKADPHPILARFSSGFSRNMVNYKNDEYDQLEQKAIVAKTQEERANIYKEMQIKLAEDAVSVFIMDISYVYAYQKDIKGFVSYPLGYFDMKQLYYE